MLTAALDAAMTAKALNFSGHYLGTGVAEALGGVVLSVSNAAVIPLVAGLMLLAAVGLAWPRTTDAEKPLNRKQPVDPEPSRSPIHLRDDVDRSRRCTVLRSSFPFSATRGRGRSVSPRWQCGRCQAG